MDFVIIVGFVFIYWFIKFRGEDVIEESTGTAQTSKPPIGNNLALKRDLQAFEKIVRELKLIS